MQLTTKRPSHKIPIYKISASMVNSWLYFLRNQSDEKLQEFHNMVKGIFISNEFLERGNKYEEEVKEGKHGQLSELANKNLWQVWGKSVYVNFENEEFAIRLAGKADMVSFDQTKIYDIKRSNSYSQEYYDDDRTSQHTFYFKLFPKATEFYYLVAAGKEEVEKIHVLKKQRPTEEELNIKVIEYLKGVLTFIKENGFWEDFKKHQEYKGAY